MEQIIFSINDAEQMNTCKKYLDTVVIPFTKGKLKCIIDLQVEYTTIRLLEDNRGENLNHIGYGDDF